MTKYDYLRSTPEAVQQMIDSLTTRMYNEFYAPTQDRERLFSRLGALLVLKGTWNEEWQMSAAEMCAATDELR